MDTINHNGAESSNGAQSSHANTNNDFTPSGENAPATPLRQQAQQLVEVTQRTAGDLAGQVQSQLTSRLTDQKNVASDAISQVADVVRQAGEGFRGQERQNFGQYADTAADTLNDFAEYLQDSDLQKLTRDVESAARRQPILFVGGAFVVGLLAGRFLRSSGSVGASALPRAKEYDPYLPAKIPASAY